MATLSDLGDHAEAALWILIALVKGHKSYQGIYRYIEGNSRILMMSGTFQYLRTRLESLGLMEVVPNERSFDTHYNITQAGLVFLKRELSSVMRSTADAFIVRAGRQVLRSKKLKISS